MYLDLVHMQLICLFQYGRTAAYKKQPFFPILYESIDAVRMWFNWIVYPFARFFAGNICGIFSTYIWQIFVLSFLSHISTFSLILIGFNIRNLRFSTMVIISKMKTFKIVLIVMLNILFPNSTICFSLLVGLIFSLTSPLV